VCKARHLYCELLTLARFAETAELIKRFTPPGNQIVLFLPRDAMRQRGLYCRLVSVRPSVRLSVRPSITLVYCIQTAISSNFFLGPVALYHSSFDPERRYPILKGTPSAGGHKIQGVGKFCDFRLKSPSISKTVRDRLMVAMER